MEEILRLIVLSVESLASRIPGTIIFQPSPIPVPHSLDIRHCPAVPRPKAPLHAIQRAAPRQLRIDAVVRLRGVLREPNARVRVREDMAPVTLLVGVQVVAVVQVCGLLRGEVDLQRKKGVCGVRWDAIGGG